VITLDAATGIGVGFTEASLATTHPDDPGFGCYIGTPGAQGLQTVWYKWTALATERTRVQTCNSTSPANDSLLAVYILGEPMYATTECDRLIPIACNDDFDGCSASNTNSRSCFYAEAGKKYYAMVASKELLGYGTGYYVEVRPTTSSFCPTTPNNNYCWNTTCSPPIPVGCITDGVTPFDFTPPSPFVYDLDPPWEPCIPTTTADMWFDYHATCTGELTVHTCEGSAQTSPDTNLAIYEGCDTCPNRYGLPGPIACNSDAGGAPCGAAAKVVVNVVEGECYTIRLGDSSQSMPTGDLTISCAQLDCPAAPVDWLTPPTDSVDARRAHPPGNALHPEGIQALTVSLPPGAVDGCFSLCETAVDTSANGILNVVENPPGDYTVKLARPITSNAKTTITYTDHHGQTSHLRLAAHPGNVNADQFSTNQDLARLTAALVGTYTLPFGVYSGDIDRSGMITAADLLALIDIWNEPCLDCPPFPNPINDPACP